MANGSSRLVPALLALVVGFAIGWFVPHKNSFLSVDGSTPNSYLIGVYATGKVSLPRATISLSQKNIVGWSAGQAKLEIVFKEKDFPAKPGLQPFAIMTERVDPVTKLKEYVVRCGGSICHSGDINPALTAALTPTPDNPNPSLEYKYDQIVAGDRTDGMIIIRP